MMRDAAEEGEIFGESFELGSDRLLGVDMKDLWSQVIMEARAKNGMAEEEVPAVGAKGYGTLSNQ